MKNTRLPMVYKAEELLDIAFRRAKKEARKVQIKNKSLRLKRAEERRVKESSEYITSYLTRLEKFEQQILDTSPFYQRLIEISTDMEALANSIERIDWAKKSIMKLESKSRRDIRMRTKDPVELRKEFYGKTASIIKKINSELDFLREFTYSLKSFPDIKEGFTLVLAGMTNVGKSSILKSLTTSTPEIKPYPFTTKRLLVGYIKLGYRKIQVIDTPGILDRPFSKRNPIEKRAILAINDLANMVIYVFDPSETCGYTLESQIDLYKEISDYFRKTIAIINKKDISNTLAIDRVNKSLEYLPLQISTVTGENLENLHEVVTLEYRKNGPEGI